MRLDLKDEYRLVAFVSNVVRELENDVRDPGALALLVLEGRSIQRRVASVWSSGGPNCSTY